MEPLGKLAQGALPAGWSPSGGAEAGNAEAAQRQAEQEQQEQERRKHILDQIMTTEARVRLSNIGVPPDVYPSYDPHSNVATLLTYIRLLPKRDSIDYSMVKPDKARRVEDMLIHAATSGKLGGKVTEGQFVQMLGQVNSQIEKKTKVTIKRRTYFDDEDPDDNDDDLM